MKLFKIVLLGMLLVGCSDQNIFTSIKQEKQDTLYQRVLKNRVIRAAYTIYPPSAFFNKEGKLVGTFVETLEEAASQLGLVVEWTEEVGWATQIEGLNTRRYDIIGSSVWSNPKRAKNTTLSIPLYYSPLFVYARSDDERFYNISDYSVINNQSIKISTVDGGTGEVVSKHDFPLAEKVALPQLSDFSQSFLDVIHNKADVLIMEPSHAYRFLAANPGTVININPHTPIRIFGNCFMFEQGEIEFKLMFDIVLTELLNSGFIDSTLKKYEKHPNSFMRVAKKFQEFKL